MPPHDSDSESDTGNSGNGPTGNSGNGPTGNSGNGPTGNSGNGPTGNSGNGPTDISLNIPVIVNDLSNTIISGVGYEIEHATGTDICDNDVIQTTFETTEPEIYDPQIEQDLSQVVNTYDNLTTTDASGNIIDSSANILLDEIKGYASELKCSDFHGKGTIDDYNELFIAASRIANETKQMELDVDIEGFDEFAQAADDLSELFNGFILKLQNVSVITDINFLTSIASALRRIVNLSETFGRFKQTIISTSAIQIPKSAQETKIVIDGVMDEINCAMNYIEYFVNPIDASLSDAQLSIEEKNIISKSVETIDNWNTLCEFGVTIAMSGDENISSIHQSSEELKQTTLSLKSASNRLREKLAVYNIY